MALLPKPKPRFFRFVAKPTNAAASELAKAQPVYIDGLPEAGAPEVTAAEFAALVARVEALEAETP